MSIYVCSDIHGKYIEWRKAIAKTDLNLENGDKLIILGDLIDRGGQSLDCVSFALNLVNKYPKQVIYLMGNHEKMMLDFLNSKINHANDVDDFSLHGKTWIGNGGRITVYSFLNGLPEGRDNFERLRATHELMWFHHGGLINQLNSLPY